MLPASDRPRLTPQLRRDMALDTLGHLSLAAGLWGWLRYHAGVAGILETPALFIALTATGLLNLLHMPPRVRRLREWQESVSGE